MQNSWNLIEIPVGIWQQNQIIKLKAKQALSHKQEPNIIIGTNK